MRRGQQPQRDAFNEHAIVAYDIETIVDDEPADGSFPPWPRHRPVAASFLTAKWTQNGYAFALDTLSCQPGKEDAFYRKVDELLPAGATAITYNGRGFDIRCLALQASRWVPDLKLPNLARQAASGRFDGAHCDLADAYAGFGGTRSVAMVELCKALDIPCKIDTSGSQVGVLWRTGQRQAVREYVAQDVICTAMLWWHYIAFQKSDEKLLTLPLAELVTWIQSEPGLAHLKPFAECRPAQLALRRVPALRVAAALADAELRVSQERDEAAFAAGDATPF